MNLLPDRPQEPVCVHTTDTTGSSKVELHPYGGKLADRDDGWDSDQPNNGVPPTPRASTVHGYSRDETLERARVLIRHS